MTSAFLIGTICALYLVGALFFLKFWRSTHDRLFLAFAAAFLMECANNGRFLFTDQPSDGSPGIYLVRLFAFALIAVAIAAKNFEADGHP